jgi:photosystem II stability/assembly factor-like uncharacterized protein
MTTEVVEPKTKDVSTEPSEMLIREARQLQRRYRRRRWAILFTLVAVIVAVVVGAAGGGRSPSRGLTLNASPSSRSNATRSDGASAVIPGGQFVQSLWPVGGQTSWAYTQNVAALSNGGQGIELTNNGGRTWRDVTPNGYNRFVGDRFIGGFFALTPTRAWLITGPSDPKRAASETVLTTDNAGRSWSRVGSLPHLDCSLRFFSARSGLCTFGLEASNSAPLEVDVTSNGGRTWTTTFDNSAGYANGPAGAGDNGLPYECDKAFILTPPATVWAEGACNATIAFLYRSTDDGRHWSLASATQPSRLVGGGSEFTGPVVLSGSQGAVAFEEGSFSLVYVTRDGGATFTPVYPPGPERPWTIDVVSPTEWRLSIRNQILVTNNGGVSWTGMTSNAFDSKALRRSQRWSDGAPNALHFTSPSFGWMTWFNGNGLYVMDTRNGGRTWTRVAVPGTETRGN